MKQGTATPKMECKRTQPRLAWMVAGGAPFDDIVL